MKEYSVEEVFDVLKEYKITSHIESVRRWLRQGVLEGIAPTSRKEGWKVTQEALGRFLEERLPNQFTTNVVKGESEPNSTSVAKEEIRATMWIELARKNIWEGHLDVKKKALQACIQHRKYSKDLEEKVWQACLDNSKAYKQPRVFYLLEAFAFDGNRLFLDKSFTSLEEQILFPVIEYVRLNYKTP
ncbi:hypothetical protein K7887_21950 (plasmid) [Sutcliffiella horikoshii]|uniref:hypothetical protein n=1 Tax=Sutcliffiella horikoshii TaxID=79883 RepID=UPI001CC06DED|nr:hypothetical protein [Sutcliffiella horikoshii]UAL49713.1 hypothetical protein K7887_21950 [Sutcliffiella horikoshii]